MDEEEKVTTTWRVVWGMIGPAFRGKGRAYALIIVVLLLATAGQVAEPVLYGRIIDLVIAGMGAGDAAALMMGIAPLLGLWVAASFFDIGGSRLGSWLGWRVANRVAQSFSQRLVRRVFGWDPERFAEMSLGAFSRRMSTAVEESWNLAARPINDILPTIVSFVAFSTVALTLEWRLALVMFCSAPVMATVVLFSQREAGRRQEKVNKAWEALSGYHQEVIANVAVVQGFAVQERIIAEHAAKDGETRNRQIRMNILWALIGFSTDIVRFFARITLFAVGIWMIGKGTTTLGTLAAMLGMFHAIMYPFEHALPDILRRLSEAKTAFGRLAPEWNRENKLLMAAAPYRPRTVRGDVAFENVTYRYLHGKRPAVDRLTLNIPAGTSLALVGPSGSGKSTVAKLAQRFFDPQRGAITLDGKDIRAYDLDVLRRNVGVVHQDALLFGTTVAENVRFAKPNATRAQVIAACRRAQAHAFIQKLPKGYDTVVGERGVKLSGGERQRIGIARVLLANTPILILDESTSALDSETESRLQEALRDAMRDRTTIIIAHRLSTVYLADQIAVMEHGRLVELGSHNELVESGGLYERLWRLQSGGYFPE